MERQGGAAPPRPAKPPGGGPPAPVHRPTARPTPASLPQSGIAQISLDRPRPPAERQNNTYVEAPLSAVYLPELEANKLEAVTSQPIPRSSKRVERPHRSRISESIICSRCKRCKCLSCARPRQLPSRWVGQCLCSAETTVDYLSCMCCVKAVFYHCCNEGEGDSGGEECADEPCSCSGNKRGARWGCLAALGTILPCLWCYWPLRGVVAVCAGAYAHTRSSGCRCSPHSPDKLPLASDPFH